MYKTEDKIFIYDNPKKIGIKYFIRYGLHVLDVVWYKLLLNILRPEEKDFKYKADYTESVFDRI